MLMSEVLSAMFGAAMFASRARGRLTISDRLMRGYAEPQLRVTTQGIEA